jgi:hypothetical protein
MTRLSCRSQVRGKGRGALSATRGRVMRDWSLRLRGCGGRDGRGSSKVTHPRGAKVARGGRHRSGGPGARRDGRRTQRTPPRFREDRAGRHRCAPTAGVQARAPCGDVRDRLAWRGDRTEPTGAPHQCRGGGPLHGEDGGARGASTQRMLGRDAGRARRGGESTLPSHFRVVLTTRMRSTIHCARQC